MTTLPYVTKNVEKKRIVEPKILTTGTIDRSSQFVTGLSKKCLYLTNFLTKLDFSLNFPKLKKSIFELIGCCIPLKLKKNMYMSAAFDGAKFVDLVSKGAGQKY